MDDDDRTTIGKRVERLVSMASGRRIREDALARHDADLRLIGLDSLGYLNLLEALERSFGVVIDLEQEADHSFLHTIDNIVSFVLSRRAQAV